jgi:hypothetical protein
MKKSTSESAVRRRATRRGLILNKFHGRNPDDSRYGTFMVSDARTGGIVMTHDRGNGFGCDLQECAKYIS